MLRSATALLAQAERENETPNAIQESETGPSRGPGNTAPLSNGRATVQNGRGIRLIKD